MGGDLFICEFLGLRHRADIWVEELKELGGGRRENWRKERFRLLQELRRQGRFGRYLNFSEQKRYVIRKKVLAPSYWPRQVHVLHRNCPKPSAHLFNTQSFILHQLKRYSRLFGESIVKVSGQFNLIVSSKDNSSRGHVKTHEFKSYVANLKLPPPSCSHS